MYEELLQIYVDNNFYKEHLIAIVKKLSCFPLSVLNFPFLDVFKIFKRLNLLNKRIITKISMPLNPVKF